MDCNKICSHVSATNCECLQIKNMDDMVMQQVNNIKIDGEPQEILTRISCYETYIVNK